MKFGLKEETINKIIAVFRDYEAVETVILYGSRATGRYQRGSDIDLVLKGNQLTLQQQLRIEVVLDDLLLPYFIDLHTYHLIPSAPLLKEIDTHGVVLYERADEVALQ